MLSYETVIYQKENRIGAITLNRPQAGNAINAQLAEELNDICSKINQDDVNVVTLTGAGGAFSLGIDWGMTSGEGGKVPWSVATAVAKLNPPVIAAINGDALGQGLELALACDLRVAAETARFGFPHTTENVAIPRDGGTQRLPRLVGKSKAIEMILLGEPIDAREAYRIGLVNKIVSPKELIPVVTDMAQAMASKAPLALRYAKEAIHKGLELPLQHALHLEADLYLLLQTTEDRIDGIRAFQEKKTPQFKGK